MNQPRTFTRPAALFAVLVAVTSLVACGTGPIGRSPAATVDGHDISVSEVTDLLDAQADYLRVLSKDKTAGADAKRQLGTMIGAGRDSWSSAEASTALDALLVHQVVLADLARHGEKITEADRSSARDAVTTSVGGEEKLKTIPKHILEFAIERGAAQTALGRVAAKGVDKDKRLRELWAQSRQANPVCVAIILGTDEASLAPAKARLDAGEDFAKVAAELSTDPASAADGGFLGCTTPDQAAAAFALDAIATAEAGALFGPVSLDKADGSGTESYLVKIESTTGPSFERARPQLEQQLAEAGTSDIDQYLMALLEKAHVTVNARFGTWDAATGRVVAPAASAAG